MCTWIFAVLGHLWVPLGPRSLQLSAEPSFQEHGTEQQITASVRTHEPCCIPGQRHSTSHPWDCPDPNQLGQLRPKGITLRGVRKGDTKAGPARWQRSARPALTRRAEGAGGGGTCWASVWGVSSLPESEAQPPPGAFGHESLSPNIREE